MTAEGIRAALTNAWMVNALAQAEGREQRIGELNHLSHPAEPLIQAFGFRQMYPLIEQGLKAAQWPLPSSRVYWVTLLTPAVLFLVAETLPTGIAEKTVHWVQHNYGNLCRVAVVVSQVAVYYFTGSSFALLYIGLHVIDTLERNRLLPGRVDLLYRNVNSLTYAISCIAMGGFFNVAAGVGSFAFVPAVRAAVPVIDKSIRLLQLAVVWSQTQSPKIEREMSRLAFEIGLMSEETYEADKFLAELESMNAQNQPVPPPVHILDVVEITPNTQFVLDPTHLTQEPLPPIPNVDPQELVNLWDEIESEMTNDPNEIRRQRTALQTVVNEFRAKNPRDDVHAHYLQLITAMLLQKDKSSQIEILQELSQPSTDQKTDIEETFAELFDHPNGLPLRVKILHRLQALRTNRFFRERTYLSLSMRWEMWQLRHGIGQTPALGLTTGGLHAQPVNQPLNTPAFLSVQRAKLQDIGYTSQVLSEAISITELTSWMNDQSLTIQTALNGNPEARLYMLVQLGILDIQRGNA